MQSACADWLVRLRASSGARNSKNRSFFQLFVTDEVGFGAIFFFNSYCIYQKKILASESVKVVDIYIAAS